MDARRSRSWKGWRSIGEGERGAETQLFKWIEQEQQWLEQIEVSEEETQIFLFFLQQILLKVRSWLD